MFVGDDNVSRQFEKRANNGGKLKFLCWHFLHIIGKDLIIRKITPLRKGSYYTPGQNSAPSKFTSYLVWNGAILNRLDVQTFKMNRCFILPRRLKQGPTHSWLPINMLSCPQNGALVLIVSSFWVIIYLKW